MITGFSHAVQISVLLKAIGVGYFLGLFFSLIMFFNAFYGKHAVSVFIRDIVFFISAAFISFLFILKYNAGTVRFYILAGEGIGFLLFYIFPGNLAGHFFRKTANKIISRKNGIMQNAAVKSAKIRERIIEKHKNRKGKKAKKKERKPNKKLRFQKTAKNKKVKMNR